MAKKKKPAPKRSGAPSSFQTQAELEAFTRYNPQASALAQMLASTRGESETRARDAVAGGEAIAQAARMARKETDKDYANATAATQARNSTLAAELGKLGPAADSYKAVGLGSANSALGRITTEGAAAKRDFSSRSSDAVAAGRYGAKAAKDQGASDARSIMDRIANVQAESGAYQAGRVGELTDAQRKRQADLREVRERNRQSDRNSRRSANVQRERTAAQERKDAADAAKPKKPKLQTNEKHSSVRSEIDRALATARQSKNEGSSRALTIAYLTSDRPSKSKRDPATNTSTSTPGRKANDELSAIVAVELAYDGALSQKTVDRLHAQKYSVKTLGLADQTAKAKRKNAGPAAKTVQKSGGKLGSSPFG